MKILQMRQTLIALLVIASTMGLAACSAPAATSDKPAAQNSAGQTSAAQVPGGNSFDSQPFDVCATIPEAEVIGRLTGFKEPKNLNKPAQHECFVQDGESFAAEVRFVVSGVDTTGMFAGAADKESPAKDSALSVAENGYIVFREGKSYHVSTKFPDPVSAADTRNRLINLMEAWGHP